MAKVDPHIRAHQEWLGFVRPTGLVVSAHAMVRAGAILNQRDTEGQRRLRACLQDPASETPILPAFPDFAREVLGWSFSPKYYAGPDDIPEELQVTLPDFGETLAPTFAVAEPDPEEGESAWQLLVAVVEEGRDFDSAFSPSGSMLEASAHGRLERLLRQTAVPAGLLFNGHKVRLVSAPRGESSGWLDLHIGDMIETAGRPICAAMRLLLSEQRLLLGGRDKRLPALLEQSRKFQNEVSERLAEQVLHALYELLRGFQAAHDQSRHVLLREVLSEHPDQVYRGLLNVLLRLVFLLYAEERDMLPEDETFLRHYSLAGLYERLREDAALNPDTMDQRYGAWSQLLVLFRMIYDGAEWGGARIPERHGVLFDPDRFPFLEGRLAVGARQVGEGVEPPKVPDGTVYRVLEKLLVLDGERISYRALDVEQIGSVYETMMGFRLETATGRSIAIKAGKKHGAPTTVDLDALLAQPASKRSKWLQDQAARKLPAGVNREVKDADTLEALHAALEKVVEPAATPDLAPVGAMVLQPSEERRKSGSHYTPRQLTEPIVRTTLRPILERLREETGGAPTPEQVLDLTVCDPAMGSGAFLVETCRQLGDVLLEAWQAHGGVPELPPDEDEVIFSRRLIAQRCLYGVDRNPVAVDLAKVSLWLATLAKDHPFTFLDHALRHGDSLVGLSRKQIEAFHWDPDAPRFQAGFEMMRIQDHLDTVGELRRQIREAGEEVSDRELRNLWDDADGELDKVRLFGDLVVAAFFEGGNATEREERRGAFATNVLSGVAESYRGWLNELRVADLPLAPFHWEIEFPEVFGRGRGGFDGVVGNPPFLGSTPLGRTSRPAYTSWLRFSFAPAAGKTDLVAYFFRRAFAHLREGGAFGLVATNTIAQGDTRESGLLQILRQRGRVYEAVKRLVWPGVATVTVSVVHCSKPPHARLVRSPVLDGATVDRITAYLLQFGPDESPSALANEIEGLLGVKPGNSAFVVADSGKAGMTKAEANKLVDVEPEASLFLKSYLSGTDLVDRAPPGPARQIWDFAGLKPADAESCIPKVLAEVRSRVDPNAQETEWYRFSAPASSLRERVDLGSKEPILCTAETSKWHIILRVMGPFIPSNKVVVFTRSSWLEFSILQSQVHELWRRTFASTLEDRLVYVASDALDTFPLPSTYDRGVVGGAGVRLHDHRDHLSVQEGSGLTGIYNRFHDPEERSPDIAKLRELHAVVDGAVLDAYGWTDISTDCEFLLDYEEEEEENSRRKKPWRYRWPDEVHDEVLARLLELNAQRAEEERLAGGAAPSGRAVDDYDDRIPDLFDG